VSLAATASRLLNTYGEPVAVTFTAPGTINPATGEGTPGATTSISGFGYPSRYRAQDVDGTLIQATDTRLVLEKIAQRPFKGWRATVDGVTFRVVDVQHIRLAGADVLYICQLRAD
jgi:hypothetical protein